MVDRFRSAGEIDGNGLLRQTANKTYERRDRKYDVAYGIHAFLFVRTNFIRTLTLKFGRKLRTS